ncbi:MAG: DEAD/DEAH box helicase family protein [candidate division WS1 bacterium]|jgi:ERCC4-related helicase|nr:DEAD/DEAH box helicase family protein [candidate division WS1 bacterium]
MYIEGDQVEHSELGKGTVELDRGDTVIVRFSSGIEECVKDKLTRVATPLQALDRPQWDRPLEVVTRIQAEAVASVNDAWGVLSRSRIALLPHQLWVCKRVLERWPARWLIADDVGLGKTIEAGLILWPLISRGIAKRIMILCPAHLIQHWQYRLRKMFDIRVSEYRTDLDTAAAEWFVQHDRVVASLQTVRGWLGARERCNNTERLERLLNSPPWDLLIVDEAHHLNYDEHGGPTLGYSLVERMFERGRVESALFFTGTPHRGKDYGFIALCELLRPDLFDREKPLMAQLPRLTDMMIRNNKYAVTDINGKRLFTKPKVSDNTYHFSPAEEDFYHMLTEFILSGHAYASELQARDGRAVMLVLVAMQKLASSSVAAIKRAISRRLERIKTIKAEHSRAKYERAQLDKLLAEYEDGEDAPDLLERLNQLDEEIFTLAARLSLMHDEGPRLQQLLEAAERVGPETKITRLLELIETQYAGRQVLLFTEYKATQSLVMSALMKRFGQGCVTFINGDDAAEDVVLPDGTCKTVRIDREAASEQFNAGEVRFLVSTEAGGEGIDLQENCHTIIHIDLPWNPMRMHQRVGRLSRYGQLEQVEVAMLRNPDTVESVVWEKLNEKIERITTAFSQTMDEPEDLLELILGMTSPTLFRNLYSQAHDVPRERLSDWVDTSTAQFGGQDVMEAVEGLVGNAAKFDYQEASGRIPKVDLPDLRPFITAMLVLNKRRYQNKPDGSLSFKTPDLWCKQFIVRQEYEDMLFDRNDRSDRAEERILGVGHPVVDEALKQARASSASVTLLSSSDLARPLIVFRISDRVTTGGGTARGVVVALERTGGSGWRIVEDWYLLQRMNTMANRRRVREAESPASRGDVAVMADMADDARGVLQSRLDELDLSFERPEPAVLAILWPDAS